MFGTGPHARNSGTKISESSIMESLVYKRTFGAVKVWLVYPCCSVPICIVTV